MIVIYHSKDLDGYCSGAICKRKYPDAKLIGYDYGQPFPWDEIPEGEPVIMVDVSLPMEDMEKLASISKQLTWIDHNKSAIQAFDDCLGTWKEENLYYIIPVLQDGIAACEGAWKYLFPDEPMPWGVELLGMYDTWRHSTEPVWEDQILPFQYGMRLKCQSPETFPTILFHPTGEENYRVETCKAGKTVLKYQRQQFEIAMHGAFKCEFQGYKAIMCNLRGAGSLAFESILKPEHQLMVGFGYTGSKWSFSLRTDKDDVDVSAIAKQFGGGGHQKAAGFAVEDINQVIDLKQWRKYK